MTEPPQHPAYGTPPPGPHAPQYPPPSPYGQPPQGPYPPYGGGGGWGQPPGSGPRKSPNDKIIAVVVIVAVLLLGLGYYIKDDYLSGGGGDDSDAAKDYPGPVYTLKKIPESLDDGRFSLTSDFSEEYAREQPKDTEYQRQFTAYQAMYSEDRGNDELMYSAATAEMVNPHYPESGLLEGFESASSMDVAVPRRKITPAGGGESLTCEVLTKAEGDRTTTLPLCSWIDPHTQGVVVDNSRDTFTTDPKSYDLEGLAERVSTIRDEVRVPA